MYRDLFIESFSALGEDILLRLNDLEGGIERKSDSFSRAILDSFKANDLFLPAMQREALRAIATQFLMREQLESWTEPYRDEIVEKKSTTLIVMAGNLPLVGFHDLLVALAAGTVAWVKLSSKDLFLTPMLIELLSLKEPFWKRRVKFLSSIDCQPNLLLSMGGERSASLFRERFSHIPTLIRGAKSSVAILTGEESENDIELLSRDLFLYFGMGCRSVGTLLLPKSYRVEELLQQLIKWSANYNLMESESYSSSYRYQRALLLMKKSPFYDGENFLLKRGEELPPPLSLISFLEYGSTTELEQILELNRERIQIVVNYSWQGERIPFGHAQKPSLDSYSEGRDSLQFIVKNS